MIELPNCWLAGAIIAHARGRALGSSFSAQPHDSLPVSGALFVFGSEFQNDKAAAEAWTGWSIAPGRLLVLVPPFNRGTCDLPITWEARYTEPLAGGETELGKMLARERCFEIRGNFLPLERNAGQIVTGGWRKHPNSGLFAVTTLPVWSLTALDHREECAIWLIGLMGQAGKPKLPESGGQIEAVLEKKRRLTRDEWAVLLHLCTGPYTTEQAALESLAASTVHILSQDRAIEALRGLLEQGYAEHGALTDAGLEVLTNSPYAVYAGALRRQHGR